MTATASGAPGPGVAALRDRVGGALVLPGEPLYAEAARGWNLAVAPAPALIVRAASTSDVSDAVRFASQAGLPVSVMATGHGLAAGCHGGLLVSTGRLRGVRVDAATGTATVAAGARWSDLMGVAEPHGLTGLPGSSPGVGVVGYSLGGGLGWLARRYGLAAHDIVSARVVTADGDVVTVSEHQNQDLLRGLRGGAAVGLGIVTSLRLRLHRLPRVYAGSIVYPLERMADVLACFGAWAPGTPADFTGAVAVTTYPPSAPVPTALRGARRVVVRGAFSGEPEAGCRLLDQLRATVGPALLDTFTSRPPSDLPAVSTDPAGPLAFLQRAELLPDITPEVVAALVEHVGPGARTPLVMVELRLLGGALSDRPDALSPMAHTRARYTLNALGPVPTLPGREDVRSALGRLFAALADSTTGETYLNFLNGEDATPQRVRAAYTGDDWAELARLQDRYDPDRTFRSGRDAR